MKAPVKILFYNNTNTNNNHQCQTIQQVGLFRKNCFSVLLTFVVKLTTIEKSLNYKILRADQLEYYSTDKMID